MKTKIYRTAKDGSMDTIKVDGCEYYVLKTGKRKFALYEDGNLVALMEKTI